jgi:hypothetical protein
MSTRPIGGSASVARRSGAVRMRRALVLAGCGVLSVGLAACESTEQESAKIGRESEAAARAAAPKPVKRHARGRPHAQSHGSAHVAPVTGATSP